ncbi:hypothetical protein OL548_06915 [Lysinibacillus sp. MHQ-1]|nr:hypothetical protein OL548_06915 [Lysinibacillus sp. MHQ-1]
MACKYGSGTASIGLKRYYILVENKKRCIGSRRISIRNERGTYSDPCLFPSLQPRILEAL